MELDQILSNEKPETPEATPEPTPEYKSTREAHREREQAAQNPPEVKAEEKPPEVPRDEAGKFTKPVEKQEMSDKERALLATATDERRKRQELEKRIAEYEARQAPATPTEPPKAFWDDPEGALGKLNQAREADKQEIVRAMVAQRLNFAEMMARQKYTDYDENMQIFREMAEQTPGLVQQCMADPDPATFAYRTAKTHKEIREAGSLEELRNRIEKETRIKLEQEYKEKHDKLLKEKAAIPDSLSNVTGSHQHKVAWGGPPALEDILK